MLKLKELNVVPGQKKLRGWKKTSVTWKMGDICEETVAEIEFSSIIYYKLMF